MDLVAPLLEWLAANPAWAGLLLFAVALGESLAVVGLIVPGAVLMFGAGALMATGHLEFWSGMAWAVAGAIVGDGLSFLLGRYFGGSLERLWPFNRNPALLRRGVHYFRLHGGKSVLLGRFVGPLRPVIPAVAGMLDMPAGRFFLVNVLSALLWAPAYLLPGMVFAASLGVALAVVGRLLMLLALVGAVGWLGWLLGRQLLHQLTNPAGVAGRPAPAARRLAVLVLILMPLGAVAWRYHPLLVPPPPPAAIEPAKWHAQPWQVVPARRQGLEGEQEPFVLQWAGSGPQLAKVLSEHGWRPAPPLDVAGAMHWLSPQPELASLPPWPRWHAGRRPQMIWLASTDAAAEREVLRVWHAGELVGREEDVWLLGLERERIEPGWPWAQAQSLGRGAEATLWRALVASGHGRVARGLPAED